MIEFDCKLNLTDFRNATMLHAKPRPAFKLMLILFLALIAMMISMSLYQQAFKTAGITILFLAIYCVVIIKNLYLMASRNSKNEFAKYPINIQIDENQIVTKSEIENSKLQLKDFYAYRESKKVFNVYMSPVMYIVLPKRCMTATEVSDVRKMLSNSIKLIK